MSSFSRFRISRVQQNKTQEFKFPASFCCYDGIEAVALLAIMGLIMWSLLLVSKLVTTTRDKKH
jgi:hypothetical protein